MSQPTLEQIRVATPCHVSWDEEVMMGDMCIEGMETLQPESVEPSAEG